MAQHRGAGAQGRSARIRITTLVAGAAFFGLGVSACTTGDVFSLQPAVDVGATTAAVRPEAPVDVAPAPMPVQEPVLAQEPVTVPDQSVAMAPALPQTPPVAAPSAPVAAAPAQSGVGLQRLVPSNPMMVSYPRLENPATTPRSAMSAEDVQCRQYLKKSNVVFRDVGRVGNGDAGGCGIENAVQVSSINGVNISPAAVLSCDMAASLAAWTRRELVPAARFRYWSGVKTIHQGSAYSCRRIEGSRTMSAHSTGNAIDIMRIELNNGSDINVRKPGLFSFRQRGFLNTVRADGCQYFTTVLGPGYNAAHWNHFHFDLMKRRNGYRACR